MAFKVFNLPVPNCAKQEREMNSFIANHRVLSRRVFATKNGEDSFLTVLLEVPEETRLPGQGTPPKIDTSVQSDGPKLGCPERQMTKEEEEILAELKQCRNEIASNLRTHLYRVATNEDLQALAMLRPKNINELRRVKGMGEKRAEQFGKFFLKVLDKYAQKEEKTGKECPDCLPGLENDALKELNKN